MVSPIKRHQQLWPLQPMSVPGNSKSSQVRINTASKIVTKRNWPHPHRLQVLLYGFLFCFWSDIAPHTPVAQWCSPVCFTRQSTQDVHKELFWSWFWFWYLFVGLSNITSTIFALLGGWLCRSCTRGWFCVWWLGRSRCRCHCRCCHYISLPEYDCLMRSWIMKAKYYIYIYI